MPTTQVSMRSLTRRICLPYAMLALIVGLWTTPVAAVYLTVPYQIEYHRAFSGNYSINLRKDGIASGDALIYSLAVTPMSTAVSNVKANGLCIQFTVDSSKLAQDFNTTVLQYAVTHEGSTGGSQTSSGILDLRASNTGFSPPNSQDCGSLPETNHVPSFNSTISAQVAPGHPFSRNLSQSVSDADTADVLTVSLAPNTVAKYGTVTLTENVLNYTANTNVPSGSTETLGLVVSDGRGGIGTSFATFTINTAPVAKDAVATAVTGQPTTINVSGLVSDGDGDALTVYALTTPAHGTATFNGLTITYTSTATYSGLDEFTYWITDGKGGTVSAKVSATVAAPNMPPVANDGAISIQEDTPADIDLATLASDPEGSFSVSAIPAAPQHGTASYTGTHITYTPALDYYGTDEFTYQVSDMQGATASAKITVTVLARNDAPSIAEPILTRRTAIDTPMNINVSENISDPDGDVLVISDVLNGPQNGTVVWSGYMFTYTPNSGFTGDDQFDYVIFDQTESSNSTAQGTIIVRVDRANNPPTAQNLETNATAGSSVVINLKNSVSDLDQDTLVISAPEKTEHGTVSLSQLTLTYKPDDGFVGTDTFTYTVTDGFSEPVTATIVVRVDGVTPQSHQINIRISGDATRVARLNSSVELRISAVDENGTPLSGFGVSWTAADRAVRTTPVFSSQDTVTDSNGAAAAVLVTTNIPSTYDVAVTVTSLETESSADAAFVVGAGLYAVAQPNTPEGAMASYLDWVCPRLQDASATLSGDAQNLLQRCDEIMNAATDGNDAQILTTLRALAPEEAAAQARTGNSFAQAQLGNIGARLAALRGGARGFALSGLAFNIKGDVVPGSVFAELFEPGARGGAAGADDNLSAPKWSAFVSGNVGGGEKNRTAQEEGFDFQTRGLTGGADYRYSNDVVFGAALGYAHSDVDVAANGGALDASGVNLALYGTWYRTQSVYIDGVLNYARNSYEQKRNIEYTVGTTTINKTARGNPDGRLLALSLGGGYEYAFKNGASVDGSLRLRYLDTTIDAYTETGAAELNLHINDQNTRLFSSSLGGRASWPLSFKWGVLIPQFDLSWEHDFDGGAHTIKGNFANEQFQNQFAFKTEDADRDYFQSGLGASAVFPGGTTGFVQYQTTLGRDHFREWNVAFGVRAELP